VQLYCVGFHCLSLHVSAYMAIFKRVGLINFQMPAGFCFAAFFSSGHTLFHLCFVPVLFSFVILFFPRVFVCLQADPLSEIFCTCFAQDKFSPLPSSPLLFPFFLSINPIYSIPFFFSFLFISPYRPDWL
jgi:hypothetical protein